MLDASRMYPSACSRLSAAAPLFFALALSAALVFTHAITFALSGAPSVAAQPRPAGRAAWRPVVAEITRLLRTNELDRLGAHIAGGANLWLPEALVNGDDWIGYLREHPALVADVTNALARGCSADTGIRGEADTPSTLVTCPPAPDRRATGVRVLLGDQQGDGFRILGIEHVLVRNHALSARSLRDAARRRDRTRLGELSLPDARIEALPDDRLDALARTLAHGCAMHQTNDPNADVPEHEVLCPPAARRASYRGPRARLLLGDGSVWRLATFAE